MGEELERQLAEKRRQDAELLESLRREREAELARRREEEWK